MPLVDVLDDTFVRARPVTMRERTGHLWPAWLPGLRLAVAEDRAELGTRWRATSTGALAATGSAEVWLETVPGGTVVHLYVRLGPAAASSPGHRRRARRVQDRVRRTWKRELHRFKDSHERDHERDHHEQDHHEQDHHGQERTS